MHVNSQRRQPPRPERLLFPWITFACVCLTSGLLGALFTFRGFVPGDSLRYATGVRLLLMDGPSTLNAAFNSEMSFAYYLLVAALHQIMGAFVQLSALMNGLSAVAAVGFAAGVFILYWRLAKDSVTAWFATAAVILAPGVWMLSYYGHPIMPGMTALVASLVVFDLIAVRLVNGMRGGYRWPLLISLMTLTLSLRLDLALVFGAFVGLLYLRGAFSRRTLLLLGAAIVGAVLLFVAARFAALGYVFEPGGGTVYHHLSNRLSMGQIPRNMIINFGQWVMAVNPVIFTLACLRFLSPASRQLLIMATLWVLPWTLFLPFFGMSIGRILAPTVPMMALLAMLQIRAMVANRYRVVAMSSALILAQLLGSALYAPIVHIYPFKTEFEGRILSVFPLGFPPRDHIFRQKSLPARERYANEVVQLRDRDVLIVGSGRALTWYEYLLRTDPRTVSWTVELFGDAKVRVYHTDGGNFFILNLNHNRKVEAPVGTVIEHLASPSLNVHVIPFWRSFPISEGEVFLSAERVEQLLAADSASPGLW